VRGIRIIFNQSKYRNSLFMQVHSHEKTLPFLVSLLDLPVSPNDSLSLDIIAEAIWTINEICFEPGMTQRLFE